MINMASEIGDISEYDHGNSLTRRTKVDTDRKKNRSVINPSKVGLKYMKKGNYLKIDENESQTEIAATPFTETPSVIASQLS